MTIIATKVVHSFRISKFFTTFAETKERNYNYATANTKETEREKA